MITAKLSKTQLEIVGEDVGQELGAKMVMDFQEKFPDEISSYFIGRNILDSILRQPDCSGIRFYSALNECGEKTLVYVGIDSKEQIIAHYSLVSESGTLATHVGIFGDRVRPGGGTRGVIDTETSILTEWGW
jgi:hypothetical protein